MHPAIPNPVKPSPWHELSSAERARIEDELHRARYRAEMSKRILLIFAFVGVIVAACLCVTARRHEAPATAARPR